MKAGANNRHPPSIFSDNLIRFTKISALAILVAIVILAAACKRGASVSSTSSSTSAQSSSARESANPAATSDFEGVVDMKSDMGGRAASLTLYMKKGRVRTETKVADLPMGEAVQLVDYSTGKAISLIPAQKAYTTMNINTMASEMNKKGEAYKFPKLTDTGKTDMIAGHQCEHYLVGDEQNVDMCMAKGLGYLGSPGVGTMGEIGLPFSKEGIANASPEWKNLLEGGAFPLKVTMSKNGQTQYSLEVTRIEPKSVADSLFAIPPGYKEIKLPSVP